jgi:threonine/homoserine/homoserine lactone efflux protein
LFVFGSACARHVLHGIVDSAITLFWLGRGLLLGFSIAAVVGPIALLCVRRTLAGGFLVGLVSGLGVATADASYAAVAGLGISTVAAVLIDQRVWLRLIGGLFLLVLGYRTVRSVPPRAEVRVGEPVGGRRLLGAYASTLGLTLSNPMTILSFGAIFAGLGLGTLDAGSSTAAVALVGGVFAGSGRLVAGAGRRRLSTANGVHRAGCGWSTSLLVG